MSSFTPAGSGGAIIPVTLADDGAKNVAITVIDMPLAATEYSYTFPTGTKQYILKLRTATSVLKTAYISGDSLINWFTVPPGCYMSDDNLSSPVGMTIYFNSPDPGQVIEIKVWY